MSKTIVITGNDAQLKNALEKNIGNFPELEIVFAMPYGEEMIGNLSIAQPNFVICDLIKDDEIKEILDVCLDTTIVIISDDVNRAESTIGQFVKEGLGRFINLDKAKITPSGVLEQLSAYNPSDDDFDEVSEEHSESVQEVDNVQETTTETVSENHEVTQDNTVQNNTETNYAIPQEEPVAKPISDFEEKVRPKMDNYTQKANSAKIGAITQCQVVPVYSKKGGTGKSTIAKEVANIFANLSLPRKISDKEKLDVCLLDLSFEQGDLRTMLGITNPNPNLYMFIDAIVTRMESGIPLEKIYFSAPEVKTNFCTSLKNSDLKLICISQTDIPKKLVDRILAFQDEELLSKIIRKIIKILKEAFNILIVDMPSSYNDITELVFRQATKIIYVLEPDLTSLDNLKTFLSSTKERCFVANKLIPVLNKDVKTPFKDTFITLFDEIKADNPELSYVISSAPYDVQVSNSNNNYGFNTITQSKFKQAMIMACSNILPVFKTKNISQDLKIVARKQQMAKKKAKLQAQKEATKRFNSSKQTPNKKEALISELQGTNTPVDNNTAEASEPQNLQSLENTAKGPQVNLGESKATFNSTKDLLASDLSKIKSLEEFENALNSCPDIRKTKKGYPFVMKKPKTINKKVWKAYYKKLSKNI